MAFSSRSFITLTLLTSYLLHASHVFAATKPYIVYMGEHSHGDNPTEDDFARATNFHHQFLVSFTGSHNKAKDAIIYSYSRHINGFAANLEEEQAAEIAKHPEVVSVFLSQVRKLHTSHSWEFMMMERNSVTSPSSIWTQARYGEDVIIAHVDSGVWPEAKSFSDENYGPVPSRWKGNCNNSGIHCNRKLIGAKYFVKGALAHGGINNNSTLRSARDTDGHGSHTLSTAGGNMVTASLLGVGSGTVKGGSPRARVATYKVCWDEGCFDPDILAGIDQAIHDGVDVLSMSLGGLDNPDYADDVLAIGSFHASMKGMVVVASAGNSGPLESSVINVAPWMITVAASTIDRDFENSVELHDGQRFKGKSLSMGLARDSFYPLITGAQAKGANASAENSMLCEVGTVDPRKVKGKIVVCLRGGESARVEKGHTVSSAGAAGMILCNRKSDQNELELEQHFLPTAHINYADRLRLLAYINSTSEPLGYITTPKPVLNQKHSPNVADFSSRGPNSLNPEILKPDLTAPGVNIIAAWSENSSLTGFDFDNRIAQFNMISGTSMSCPHVAGVAGLLKTLHPDWSPAAIKSALMTTGRTRDNRMSRMLDGSNFKKATPFMYGSGHIRPNSAMDPGLVYDLSSTDYLDFLCAAVHNKTGLRPFFGKSHYKCDHTKSVYDLNYPSIALPNMTVGEPFTVTRRLKNVGPISSYSVDIHKAKGVRMSVDPTVLVFEHPGQEITYKLTVAADSPTNGYVFGGLTWSDGTYYVRSPIAIQTY